MNVLAIGGAGFIGSHIVDRPDWPWPCASQVDELPTDKRQSLELSKLLCVDAVKGNHSIDVGVPDFSASWLKLGQF